MSGKCEDEFLMDANGLCLLSEQTKEKCEFRNGIWCFYVEDEAE